MEEQKDKENKEYQRAILASSQPHNYNSQALIVYNGNKVMILMVYINYK